MALSATSLKAAIDDLVTKGNNLITLRAAPTVTTLGAAKAALSETLTAFDAMNTEIADFTVALTNEGATNI